MRKDNSIDVHIEKWETLVGLAKEAAKQPTPVAQRDAHFYLQQAEQSRGKKLDPDVVRDVDAAFFKSMPERIARIEAVVKRYGKEESKGAKGQLEWYTGELARLKELQKKP